jgi:pyruvate,water dikinase
MRRAAAVVTETGGRTSHAAIVSRELGLPAVVGAVGALARLSDGQQVTVSCAEGSTGHVYDGRIAWDERTEAHADLPATQTKVMINLAVPEAALRWWALPHDGIGLARIEFIVANRVGIHPMALLQPERVTNPAVREEIRRLAGRYDPPAQYFVKALAEGIGAIAVAQYPRPVLVRTSDFKTNEYARLLGGESFEPHEENPMLGWRGASRYYDPRYRPAFALECQAIRHVREQVGLTNVAVMIPFCRSVEEADRVLAAMAEEGLVRGANGLQVYLMCEVPSNVVMADEFARRFDGFSIGSNDLTQLVLGVDRDSIDLRALFDERDPAVRSMIHDVIERAHAAGITVGICGQAPSDYPEFAAFLVERGIDSISVNPDAFSATKRLVAETERRLGR